MKNYKTILLFIILGFGILIYNSPDEAWWYKKDNQDAIKIGRRFAFSLLNSYKKGLLKISVEPAKSKILNSDFKCIPSVEMADRLKNKKIHISLTDPLFGEQGNQNIELIAFEQIDGSRALGLRAQPKKNEALKSSVLSN